MREVIRRQHKALSTEESYIGWLRRYMKALRKMPEGLSSEKKLELFLTDLARYRDVSASTQNQAFNAIRFFLVEALNLGQQNEPCCGCPPAMCFRSGTEGNGVKRRPAFFNL